MIHFKDNKNKSALSTRWAQMSKQEQIIERKKMEIQAKLESQKQAAALAAQAKLSNPSPKDDKGSANIFSNDGSFMSQFKALLEKQKQDKQEKDEKDQQIDESLNEDSKDITQVQNDDGYEREHYSQNNEERRRSGDKGSREKHRRWNDRSRNHPHVPITPIIEDRNKIADNKNSPYIPPLMQLSVMPPDEQDSDSENQWMKGGCNDSDEDQDSNVDHGNMIVPNHMVSGSMGSCPLPPGIMAPGMMGPGPNMGPALNMGPGPNMGPRVGMGHGPNMGPGSNMGPGPNMGQGHPLGPGPMGHITNMGPMGPGPNMGPNGMGSGPNMGMSHSSNMGPGPMMRPGGPNMPPMPPGGPMPPYMGGPPNYPMPPSYMGPNGPRGPCGPGPMPPNMCGPNMSGPPGPNGPMPSFYGPPFPNSSMMGPNCPPNSMMGSNSGNMPYMGPRPPFGPSGPNFGSGNVPPRMSFMAPNSMPPNTLPLHTIPEPKPLDAVTIPPPEPMKPRNIPSPMPLPVNHIPKPKDIEHSIMGQPNTSQVLSADAIPPSVHRAASEVACNGDHWENVLKAIHSQDQNMWFLHNTNSNEYKMFRDLVHKMRSEGPMERKPEVKPEDKYEPEFCLEDDDDSNDDSKQNVKEEYRDGSIDSYYHHQYSVKREQGSSQSDEEPESKRDRRKRKKSRWGDDPPADIKPPGVVAPLPGTLPGVKLGKIDEDGLKLTTVNRNNQALMQYAMTNYGTTNLSPEDWKKCEDNFKLNLLYQDMLKKRQEVERLAAAGKNKYEYDSDEDTSEGTWEHRLRAREMNATERWADELTKQAAGKHHIGDFLPPEELKKFMEKYSAVKSGKEPDLSDYKEFKLKEDNLGFKMLQKLGWSEGQGLGLEGSGIVDPINKANQPVANLGLGASASDIVCPEDDEFDAYRKRMMLAYRFRPNPLNNPRRPYY